MSTFVLSDLHIGDARVDRNLPSLFRTVEDLAAPNSHLVLNGDIFDFAIHMGFDSRHREFVAAARRHAKVTHIQGNHDWILADLGQVFGPHVECRTELRLVLGGKRFHVLHGHQSDLISNSLPRLNRLIIRANHWIAMALGIDLQMCLRATRLGKRILQKQEDRMARYGDWAHVVVTGHTHRPAVREVGDRTYINTGDWLERTHRSFLRIDDDGEFELTTLED